MRADGGHVGDTQNEADGIQNVGFATTVQASDGIEALVPALLSVLATSTRSIACRLFTYHPETTVRTAYDLKPCDVVSGRNAEGLRFTNVYDDFGDPHGGGFRGGSATVVVVDIGKSQCESMCWETCERAGLCLQKIGGSRTATGDPGSHRPPLNSPREPVY